MHAVHYERGFMMNSWIKRAVLYIAAAAFVAVNAAIFSGNTKKERRQPEPVPQVSETPAEAVSAVMNAEESVTYIVIAENGYLNLYRTGADKALEKSERLDIGLFPDEDSRMLAEGVEFDNAEAAFEFMESFVS